MEENEKNLTKMAGREVIRAALEHMPHTPGVYRMLDAADTVLYVGKARNLPDRVAQYTQISSLSERIKRMVYATSRVEVTTTKSEAEALMLEATLVKKFQPRYNILLKDGKSFPYIAITRDHPFGRIMKYRGPKTSAADYFGPFVTANAVDETITTLQKAFLLRPCSDNVFRNRTRPCLQYEIKRCSAPCVGYITEEDYGKLVAQAKDYLNGDSTQLQEQLQHEMEMSSLRMEYEKAAGLRDRIQALTHVQNQQQTVGAQLDNTDVIAMHREGVLACIQVFSYRKGRCMGNQAYFPAQLTEQDSEQEILSQFIAQYYEAHEPPATVIVSHTIDEAGVIEEALRSRTRGAVSLQVPIKGDKRAALQYALENAQTGLAQQKAIRTQAAQVFENLRQLFHLPSVPQRIEVYDNSHISGTEPVSAMIVATPEGFAKTAYRKFRIDPASVQAGDDYAMMRSTLKRRFEKLRQKGEEAKWPKPDLVIVDGGAGQLNVAVQVLAEFGIEGIGVVGIAKGPDRNAGREWIYLPGRDAFQLDAHDPVLHYLQRLRDEAHHFAITFHRARRSAALSESGLDAIEGIGPKRKKALLNHFGSLKAVSDASLADLERAPGIEAFTAQKIFDFFH